MNNSYDKGRVLFFVLILIFSDIVLLHAGQREGNYLSDTGRFKQKRVPVFAIKTNVLYWIGLTSEFNHTAFTPNLTLEYFISQRWSIQASGMYAYWNSGHERTFWGISGYSVEPRCWLKAKNNAGFYVGAFAQIGDYDVRNKSKQASSPGQTENYTGKYRQAGVSAGYYWTIYKGLGVETGLRAGYRDSDAREYEWSDPDKFYIGERNADKWGVMEWNISLAYRF
ncbi:DUF3575 domain-containing protein [Parabacteroides sp. OttesenSCG-928-K15]|nr:DUF3575 domain-containing protein [Parabacteroides sp. OttesenSCG-928-K15]